MSSGANTTSYLSFAAIVLYWVVGAWQTGNWGMTMEVATALVALFVHIREGLRPFICAIAQSISYRLFKRDIFKEQTPAASQ